MKDCKTCKHFSRGVVCEVIAGSDFCSVALGEILDEFADKSMTAAKEGRKILCSNANCQMQYEPKEEEDKVPWWKRMWRFIITEGKHEQDI